MKIAENPFDRLVEQHYPGIYKMAVDLVSDPEAAARITQRAFRHARDLMSETGDRFVTRRTLAKIVFLEGAADSLRIATA
jgi:hypothetical protein